MIHIDIWFDRRSIDRSNIDVKIDASIRPVFNETTLLLVLLRFVLPTFFQTSQAPTGAAWYPVALVFATVACAVASHSLERAQRHLFLAQLALTGTIDRHILSIYLSIYTYIHTYIYIHICIYINKQIHT